MYFATRVDLLLSDMEIVYTEGCTVTGIEIDGEGLREIPVGRQREILHQVIDKIDENIMYDVFKAIALNGEYKKIPSRFKVGGQEIEVKRVERCDENNVGQCCLCSGLIEIADKFERDTVQSDSSKVNTFYHELTHAILRTMGEFELNDNEKFVCCFAGFLTDAMANAYFKEENGTEIHD